MDIKIEKNIPMPGDPISQVLRLLDVGDSFVIAVDRRNACSTSARNIGIKVRTKKHCDGQIRVWRVK